MKLLFLLLFILTYLEDGCRELIAAYSSTALEVVVIKSRLFALAFSNLGYRLISLILS